jgi:hypothetical protein
MNNNEKILESIRVLNLLKEDAKMALSGEWNRSTEGFNSQIYVIDKVLKELKTENTEQEFINTLRERIDILKKITETDDGIILNLKTQVEALKELRKLDKEIYGNI